MDMKTLQSLRIGDTVRIHFTHPAAGSDARSRPFDVVIAKFHHTHKAFKDDDGKYYEARQIGWRWEDLPEELHPHPSTRNEMTGLDICSESWIIELVKRGPYRSATSPRNYLYHHEQTAFLERKRADEYLQSKGDRPIGFKMRNSSVGFLYNGFNETYQLPIGKGRYNGHLFTLATAILARQPQLTIPNQLDPDLFYAAWNAAGRPGYAGAYRETSWSPFLRDRDGNRIDPSLYKSLINKKAFTTWVKRNVHRFVMSKKTILAEAIQFAEAEEEAMIRSLERDMEEDRFF